MSHKFSRYISCFRFFSVYFNWRIFNEYMYTYFALYFRCHTLSELFLILLYIQIKTYIPIRNIKYNLI